MIETQICWRTCDWLAPEPELELTLSTSGFCVLSIASPLDWGTGIKLVYLTDKYSFFFLCFLSQCWRWTRRGLKGDTEGTERERHVRMPESSYGDLYSLGFIDYFLVLKNLSHPSSSSSSLERLRRAVLCLWSERTALWSWFFPSTFVGSGDQTQVARLAQQMPYPLSIFLALILTINIFNITIFHLSQKTVIKLMIWSIINSIL